MSNANDAGAILERIYTQAAGSDTTATIAPDILSKVDYICRNEGNRAGVRLLMACLLAKLDRPEIDVRKPYTQIGGNDSFSGRTYDEQYVAPFVIEHDLPCNSTTAFLTPALRNRNIILTPDVNLVGRPPQVYQSVLDLLAAVYQNQITAETLLTETVRRLIALRDEQKQRLADRLAQLRELSDSPPLSAESIVTLIQQHLACKNASRLPVLVITAAYQSASTMPSQK